MNSSGEAVELTPPLALSTDHPHSALGQNLLREGAPWAGWALLLAATAILASLAALGLERRNTRQ